MTKEQLDMMLNHSRPAHSKEIKIPAHAIKLLESIGRWKEMDHSKDFKFVDVGDYGRNDMDGLPRVKPNPLRSKYGP